MNTTALYFAEWREHFESDVFFLYHLCSERSGVCIDFCVVMKEDLTYTVSFKGTVIDFQKFLTGASTNRRLWKLHSEDGGTIYKVNNVFAADVERPLFFVSDPPHLLKTIRNCLLSKKRKLWVNHLCVCTCTCTIHMIVHVYA